MTNINEDIHTNVRIDFENQSNFHKDKISLSTVGSDEDNEDENDRSVIFLCEDDRNGNTSQHSLKERKDQKEMTVRNLLFLFQNRLVDLFMQLTLSEISGSLGDLGTFIPLLISMARQRAILLAPALFFAGLSNIITGFFWDVPMCVQPMKSIAAIALSENLSKEAVTASGILTGVLIFLLGITNMIELVNKIIPNYVVSGLQIGVGLKLAISGLQSIAKLSWTGSYDCITLAIICSLFCMYWLKEKSTNKNSSENEYNYSDKKKMTWIKKMFLPDNHPVGIYLFGIGTVFAIVTLITTTDNEKYQLPLKLFGAPVAVWVIGDVTIKDWKDGLLQGAIPQIPLTTLNSVISVCALAHSLYPEKRKRSTKNNSSNKKDGVLSRKEVSISVGLMNICFCPFGSMPNCHGAGGLAGQHRFGARHGTSVVFLGIAKMLLAIFLGSSALTLLDAFPTAVLGVMLAIAGQELATTGFTLLVSSVDQTIEDLTIKKQSNNDDNEINNSNEINLNQDSIKTARKKLLRKATVITIVTALVIVAIGKTHYGALSGWVTHMIYGDGASEIISRTHKCVKKNQLIQKKGLNSHLDNTLDTKKNHVSNP